MKRTLIVFYNKYIIYILILLTVFLHIQDERQSKGVLNAVATILKQEGGELGFLLTIIKNNDRRNLPPISLCIYPYYYNYYLSDIGWSGLYSGLQSGLIGTAATQVIYPPLSLSFSFVAYLSICLSTMYISIPIGK